MWMSSILKTSGTIRYNDISRNNKWFLVYTEIQDEKLYIISYIIHPLDCGDTAEATENKKAAVADQQ